MRSHGKGAVGVLVAACAALAMPAVAAAVSPKVRGPQAARDAAKPFFDSRDGQRAAGLVSPAERSARSTLTKRLGAQADVSMDRVTGTVRTMQKLDGALTAPATGDRGTVAMSWVRANRAALGLTAADVDGLTQSYRVLTARSGVTHLRYRQDYRGIPAFDNDLRVNVDRGGRILNVTGSPVSGLSIASIVPALDATAAVRALQRDVGVARAVTRASGPTGVRRVTRFGGQDEAKLVLFTGPDGPRLAWHVDYQATTAAFYDAVVDATTGAVLFRQNLTKFDSAATVWPNYPGGELQAPPLDQTNQPRHIDLETAGTVGPPWITAAAPTLDGAYSHAYSDIDEDDTAEAGEEIPRRSGGDFDYPLAPFGEPPGFTDACDFSDPEPDFPDPLSPGVICSWDPTVPTSWQTNREQNGVQAFYLVSRYHDHLANPNIGFTDDTDGFGGTRTDDQDDPVLTETDDGAATAADGGPDGDHINNANMTTFPDGQSPRMQMFLFAYDPEAFFTFRDMNGGDDAGTVWHEYTHGLSNRLVVDAEGNGALSSPHAGAMGEAWSDWYALDLLNRDGLELDDPNRAGEVDIGLSTDARFTSTRFEPIDCPVNTVAPRCPGGIATGPGGYTFGDFGKVFDGPEVHSDGEIWMQTLWDLRTRLVTAALGDTTAGSDRAEALVTEAMRLSPPEPSYLDMRNAILAADTAIFGGDDRDLIWRVFADRGMGFFASVDDSSDVTPFEDFNVPPDPAAPTGTAAGTVTSADSGLPVPGVTVGPGGHTTDPSFPDFLGATTAADGSYTLPLPAGHYGSLNFLPAAGFDRVIVPDLVIGGGRTTTNDAAVRRDWAASKGGGTVLKDDTKFDNTGAPFGCGLDQLIDQSQGAGSSAFNPDSADPGNPHLGPPTAVVALPQAVTVSAFGLDPSNTCGDDETASTKDFRIETSADGVNFNVALQGSFTSADLHRLNVIAPAANATNVRFVRLTMLSPQSTNPGDSGVDFIDFSEIEVFGGPPNVLPSGALSAAPGAVGVGQAVSFDASSFRDPDSKITGYDWDFDGNGTVDRSTAGPTTSFAYPAAGRFAATVAAKDFRGGVGRASAAVTVNGAAVGGETTTNAPPALRRLAVVLPRTATKGRVRFRVACTATCSVKTTLTLTRASAKALGLKRRTIQTRTRRLTPAQARQITVTLPASVRRAATRHHRKAVDVVLAITARQAGRATTTHRTVHVRL